MNKPSATPTLIDAAARERLVTDLTTSLIVEAGAGSGKTHEMARRMAAGVKAGVYQVEHMAAVTFTRKAAAELRGRFQAALEAELASHRHPVPPSPTIASPAQPSLFAAQPAESAEVERLQEALANIERLFSGTIHAFCARLLRERPIEAGVAPGFRELDEVDERLMREASWREFRARARAEGDRDLALLNDAGVRAKELDDAFAAVCNYEDVEFPAHDEPMPDVDGAWSALEAFWQKLTALLPESIDSQTTCKVQQRSEQFQRSWTFARRGHRSAARLAELLGIWDSTLKIVQKWWSEDKKRAKEISQILEPLHAQFRVDVVSPWLTQWRRHLYGPTMRLLTRARAQAQQDRRMRNTLSFNDLLMRTAAVLRENQHVRTALQDKYRWIFVDEFQDTDPLQAEIMSLLSSRALYVVGDPKQSIYRFRRADIDIYHQVRREIGGADDAGVVSLTTNFRSVPQLCDWVNTVFATRFPQEPSLYAPAFAPLQPFRTVPVASNASALATLTAPDQAAEAAAIARYIAAEVTAGRRTYADFLILTRKRKPLTVYAEALEALQIPLEVAGAGAFGNSAEVRELARLLAALADPQDAVARVGVLRGPFFGVSDRQLFAERERVRQFWQKTDEAAGVSHPVAAALEVLQRWHKYTRVYPIGAALAKILDESGYLALAATTPGGVEAGDVLHAVDRVRSAVESGYTLADAAEMLQDESHESAEIESWPLEPGRPDVVRLMNLHKAKGLEAPVVFLADPNGGYRPGPDIRIVRTADSAVGYLPIFRSSEKSWVKVAVALPPDWESHQAEEQLYLEAEEERLLYVAATRARDMLVVGRATRPDKSGAWDGLAGHLAGVPDLDVPAVGPSQTPVSVDVSDVPALARAAEAAHEAAVIPTWFANSVTETQKQAIVGATRGLGADDTDPTVTLTESTSARRADAGVAWGTLVHGLLEHAMRFPQSTSDDLRRLATWLTVEEPDLRQQIDLAVATVQGVAQATFWADARAADEVHEEAPFAVADHVGDVPGVLTGVIDLVYRTADGQWHIVDYKTDVGGGVDALTAKYSGQMRAYEKAWGSVAGGTVTATLVSTRTTSS